MQLSECNPFLRTAEIQPAILEGSGPRMAYDHRLFYVLEREGTLLLDNRTVALAPDTLIFIPPAVGYNFRGKLRVVVLNFDMTRACAARTIPICPPPAAAFDPALCFDLTLIDGLAEPVVLPGDTALQSAVLELVQRFSGGGAQVDAASSARLKLLLADLLSRLSPRPSPSIGWPPASSAISAFTPPRSRATLRWARSLAITRSTSARFFAANTGRRCTPPSSVRGSTLPAVG